jgi:GcrA cell cycle regulator
VGRRAVGEPDRRRARRHHAQRGDRQGAPPWAIRARQVAVVLGAAGAQAALAHDAGVAQEPEPELIENIIPIGQRRTLLELNEDTCRWPIGDPASAEFFFCGGKPLTGLPYCSYHSRVAYQPATDRRRDRPKPPFRQG